MSPARALALALSVALHALALALTLALAGTGLGAPILVDLIGGSPELPGRGGVAARGSAEAEQPGMGMRPSTGEGADRAARGEPPEMRVRPSVSEAGGGAAAGEPPERGVRPSVSEAGGGAAAGGAADMVGRVRSLPARGPGMPAEEPPHAPREAGGSTAEGVAALAGAAAGPASSSSAASAPGGGQEHAVAPDPRAGARWGDSGRGPAGDAGTGAAAGHLLALAAPGDGRAMPAEYGPYLSRFRQAVQDAVTYPLAARRAGHSGTVQIEVLIEPTGRIREARVLSSSRHAMLDEAALEALRRVSPMPLPENLPRRPLRVRLPLVFELR